MEQINTWKEVTLESLKALGSSFMGALPQILGALLLILIGWLVAKIVSTVVQKILGVVKFNQIADKVKIAETLGKANISLSPTKIVGKFLYWFIFLYFIVSACDTMGWSAVSIEIGKIIGYLPKLLVAIIILLIGIFIANVVRKLILTASESFNISTGKLLAGFVFYLLLIMVIFTSLNQAGIDISLITSNFTIIFGGLILAFAVSYGFASKDILQNILSGIYNKNRFSEGDIIAIDSISGKIIAMDNLSVTIQNDSEQIIIPASELTTKRVIKRNS